MGIVESIASAPLEWVDYSSKEYTVFSEEDKRCSLKTTCLECKYFKEIFNSYFVFKLTAPNTYYLHNSGKIMQFEMSNPENLAPPKIPILVCKQPTQAIQFILGLE